MRGTIHEIIGNKVREMRKQQNISQQELAFRTWGHEARQSVISDIESGKLKGVTLESVHLVLFQLGCDMREFFIPEEEKPKKKKVK